MSTFEFFSHIAGEEARPGVRFIRANDASYHIDDGGARTLIMPVDWGMGEVEDFVHHVDLPKPDDSLLDTVETITAWLLKERDLLYRWHYIINLDKTLLRVSFQKHNEAVCFKLGWCG